MEKKAVHSKRTPNLKHPSAHLHPPRDSPAYDASEEDNDPLTDDASGHSLNHSLPPSSRSTRPIPSRNQPPPQQQSKGRHALASSVISSDEGVDSPTYDGDIESSTTLGQDNSAHSKAHHYHHHHPSSVPSTLSPTTPASRLPHEHPSSSRLHDHQNIPLQLNTSAVPRPTPSHPSRPTEPPPVSISVAAFNPADLTPNDIQEYVRSVIAGPGIAVGSGSEKKFYKINEPPQTRPVRVYADGVYDLFHFGHALQLRQSKLSFPALPPRTTPTASPSIPSSSLPSSEVVINACTNLIGATPHVIEPDINAYTPGVYLLVGVNSDQQCTEHKSRTVMSHAERCESVRHCRWVDEVVPDAPWVIDQAFLDKYNIDYVAHDEDPYGSAGHDDVYAYSKTQGKFLPTRRTPGISTSDLLARLVSGYRHRAWDKKLEKMGLRQLMAEGSDWDESRINSRAVSTDVSREGSRAHSPERSPDKSVEWNHAGGGGEV